MRWTGSNINERGITQETEDYVHGGEQSWIMSMNGYSDVAPSRFEPSQCQSSPQVASVSAPNHHHICHSYYNSRVSIGRSMVVLAAGLSSRFFIKQARISKLKLMEML